MKNKSKNYKNHSIIGTFYNNLKDAQQHIKTKPFGKNKVIIKFQKGYLVCSQNGLLPQAVKELKQNRA